MSTFASHGRGVLRKSVSSPAAAAVVCEVHKIVDQADNRVAQQHKQRAASPYKYPLETCKSKTDSTEVSPRQYAKNYMLHDDMMMDARSMDTHTEALEGQKLPPAGQNASRFPVPDGPVYSAFQLEVTSIRDEGTSARSISPVSSSEREPSGILPASGEPVRMAGTDMARNDKEDGSKLDELKNSNHLLRRALAAVQHRLQTVESERDQLRRERDYFRNMALRFPFSFNVHNTGESRKQFADP
uniref:Uncharacterized protein n=1 Tax=Hanusia phi TaxID=3032 RepID=A0A7S0I3Q2_9CRYP|mmetsp:Transcript_9301/g.21238  ORF Transcript_9301/g.21238 Transcript_9301/m.21238 type:complete len:243 (+) Transcript_9301:130-858(+)|eukprot:768188-Hanusia_phi.AAC.2